jgi:CRP-like cAMP-binding protein
MGRHSICKLGPWLIGGGFAWVISRVTNLMALPGLERNLRILVDWFLDIPFRADIAVLAPDATERLQRCHYEAGDEIIHQGDTGDTAYVIEAGRVEVVTDGRKVTEYGPGDFFGELALVSDSLRTATVRCLTPCELTVLSRDDFHTLTVGSGTLANAIRKQIDERLQAIRV